MNLLEQIETSVENKNNIVKQQSIQSSHAENTELDKDLERIWKWRLVWNWNMK